MISITIFWIAVSHCYNTIADRSIDDDTFFVGFTWYRGYGWHYLMYFGVLFATNLGAKQVCYLFVAPSKRYFLFLYLT